MTEQDQQNESGTGASSGDPIRVLFVALAITAIALLAGMWSAYDSYQRFELAVRRNAEIQELRGRIVFLDEVLTMSARMGAATGDRGWEDRYRRGEAELEQVMAGVLEIAPGTSTTRKTEMANEVLVELEDRAFQFVQEKRLAEAEELLRSSEYQRQKKVYADGMSSLGLELDETAETEIEVQRRRILVQFVVGGVVLVFLVVAWVVVLRAFRNWLVARQALDSIERDLDTAREIQRGLLPRARPDIEGYEIAGWSRAADKTGGDYFDWMPLPEGRILVAIADVSGHGIGPAIIASVCRAYVRSASGGAEHSLARAVERVNDLLELDIPASRFVTSAVGVLIPERNQMELVSAGQAPLLFHRAGSEVTERWSADGMPLGIVSGMTLGEGRSIDFAPGDVLVLTTDGFFEWQDPSGEQYGLDRLERFVQEHAREPAEQLMKGLYEDVLRHAAGVEQSDDVTIVVVRRDAEA